MKLTAGAFQQLRFTGILLLLAVVLLGSEWALRRRAGHG